jgi:hypothetical protein
MEQKSASEPRVIYSAGPDNSCLLCKTIICHFVHKTLRAAFSEPVGYKSESYTLYLSNPLKCVPQITSYIFQLTVSFKFSHQISMQIFVFHIIRPTGFG